MAGRGSGPPIGILGGTFDPIHNAHLALAEAAANSLGLAQVRLIPAGDPYHRSAAQASGADRLAMLQLALAGNPRLAADERDLRRNGPTYSVDTLASLRAEFGDRRPLVLLLGADAFLDLESWRDWRRLFELAHLGVAARPGHADWRAGAAGTLAAEIEKRIGSGPRALRIAPAGSIVSFPMTPLDISATRIRVALAARQPTRDLLPAAVLDYIDSHGLYRGPIPQTGGQ